MNKIAKNGNQFVKIFRLIFVCLCLITLSACHSNEKVHPTKNNGSQLNKTRYFLSKQDVLAIKAQPLSNFQQKISIHYSSALSEKIVKATNGANEQRPYQSDYDIKVPRTWEQVPHEQSQNVYTFTPKKQYIDIWSEISVKEDKNDPIMGLAWMTSSEVLTKYIKKQGVTNPEVFDKKIGDKIFSVSVNQAKEYNQSLVTYSIINEDGNFSSSAIMVNVIMSDSLSKKDQSAIVAEVEGVLEQLKITQTKE